MSEKAFSRMTRATGNFFGVAMLMAVLAGCGADHAPKQTASQQAKTASVESTEPQISVQHIDKAGLAAVIGHLPGKVILIDFWATWCPQCRENFPHTVELSHKFGPEGLIVISLACDDASQTEKVRAFLREQNATFQNLRSAFGSDEKTFEDFEIEGGALPHYKLFDRKGTLYRTFASDPSVEKQFSLEEIDAAIEELLAAKPMAPTAAPATEQPEPVANPDGETSLTSPTRELKRLFSK